MGSPKLGRVSGSLQSRERSDCGTGWCPRSREPGRPAPEQTAITQGNNRKAVRRAILETILDIATSAPFDVHDIIRTIGTTQYLKGEARLSCPPSCLRVCTDEA